MSVAIDKNVPIPASRSTKYPWRQMEVGDSFVYQADQKTASHAIWQAQKSINDGRKFKCAIVITDDSKYVRIWRIA